MKNNLYKVGIRKATRHMALGCLLFFTIVGNLMAQNDSPFVIKKDGNYLAHEKVGENYVLRNASSFDPATCLWYSGPTYNPTGYTHNYYFEDEEGELRFLAAPLEPDGTLSLSSSLPSVSLLRNTDQVYYFYNWDPETSLSGVPEGGGLAKGHRYYVSTQDECEACGENNGASWYVDPETGATQCWEAYWIEYDGSGWQLSSASSYNATPDAARYRKVTITEHEKDVTAGGLTTLTAPTEMSFGDQESLSAPVSATYSYIPAYTNYVFLEGGSESVHNYWDNTDHLNTTPTQQNNVSISGISYQWTISGDGVEYLSFNSDSDVNTTTTASPTLYYRVQNNTGHKTATITVTVTYTDGNNEQFSQTLTATVLVKTPCQNPEQAANPVVTYAGVTVSWVATADRYLVDWKEQGSSEYGTPVEVTGVNSYTITGLDYQTQYDYRVTAYCDGSYLVPPTDPTGTFTTLNEPGMSVFGAIFGGGRMADVGGKTEIVIVNCDSIGGIFGGNDIAGEVRDANGSTIVLGINSGNATTYGSYGSGITIDTIRVGSVYGGGNGYYAYNGESFVAAAKDSYESQTVTVGSSVMAMTPEHTVGDVAWTNTGTSDKILEFPKIVKTAITVSNNYVIADSIFGGAKNAFLTENSGNGSTITIDGGTIMAVFGGNNFGGSQGYGKHYIEVNGTKTKLALDIQNTATTGYGRNFGIRDLFGGGNKVYGSTTDIRINGGQTDNVFGGGNSADVYRANVTVNCALDAYSSDYTYGNTYTNAIQTYEGGVITPKPTGIGSGQYNWNGKGIYNVRNLYGGNNMEAMASVPTVTLTSGSVGTVYGGGNAGDMLAFEDGTIDEDGNGTSDVSFQYSTSVTLNSADMIVDYIYGGCRMSNVDYSTWVEIQDGHVGTAFGGCNVSGDVGSTRVNPDAATQTADYQAVQGGTYVHAKGGTVYKNLFAGGNGFYHCNENFHYVEGINYTNENFVGMILPTHNETHVYVSPGATVKGNVYAGGNLAPVGFPDAVASYFPSFPTNVVGWALVHVYGGTIEGNVFGGGNMADIYGNNDVMVAGGTISAVYGGNDRTGSVAGEFSNRVLPAEYEFATDGHTSLIDPEVHAYVRITGKPTIEEVYGGGNGDYDYVNGDEIVSQYCNANEAGPIQSNTFVDINIDGGSTGGHIGTVYGGGDGVTATGFITVLMNINETVENHDNVGVIFGGNNKGDLNLAGKVPDIILLHGQVGTVYGGCNEGAMTGSATIKSTDNVETYTNVGSLVRLRRRYTTADNHTVYPSAVVSNAVYGGCRMNGVTNNSLVLAEGGTFLNTSIFGGSDISGEVGKWSKVVVRDDAAAGSGNGNAPIVGNLYGGGNGNYDYSSGTYVGLTSPICAYSGVDVLSGQVGDLGDSNKRNVFGGGYGQLTNTLNDVVVNIGPMVPPTANSWVGLPTIYGDIYGGSALGRVNRNELGNSGTTTVNFLNGKLVGNLFGGSLGRKESSGVTAIPAWVYGKVFVNISNAEQDPDSCFIDLRDADIYGCNNTNGSPQDDVTVHVWKTAFNFGDGNDYTSETGDDPNYAIGQVFGGGNEADYAPQNGDVNSRKRILVHVHDCVNTIRRVFAGGNAAAATGVSTLIEGGRMDHVFGGGNGEVTAANVGLGGTNTEIQGGIINHLYGGSNKNGDISGPVITEINNNSGCPEIIGEFFGGASLAGLNPDGITTTIECGTGTFGTVYGGSETADINGDVTLNIRGGTITNVFGGSKGTEDDGADISGKVTLNLEGGDITNAFGGNNIRGLINDSIVVNVLDFGVDNCGLQVDTIYGGGNLAAYAPTNPSGPVVNVMHIAHADGVKGHVYGGGKKAQVTGNPIVNIGYDNTMSDYLSAISIPDGITLPSTNDFRAYVKGRVFGGGEEAGVTGTTTVNMNNGSVIIGIYGGCYTSGTVTTDAVVNIYDGTIGTSTSKGYIFGGGYGEDTKVGNNVTVNFGDLGTYANANPTLYGELYGGSALGTVNTDNSNTTCVYVLNGTITGIPSGSSYDYGKVFGGGLGRKADTGVGVTAVEAEVFGKVHVQIGTYTDKIDPDTYSGNATLINCDVFGCNNTNGSPQDSVYVDVYKTAHTPYNEATNLNGNYAIHEIFGGGNEADYMITNRKAVTWIHGCDNTIDRLFGGGNAAHVRGVVLTIDGGRLGEVFGGGNGEVTAANIGVAGESGTIGTEVITLRVGGGLIGVLFLGSNMQGEVYGNINEQNFSFCEELSIIDHFMGSNQTDIIGNITSVINCGPNFDPYDPDYDPESGEMPTGQSIEMRFVNLYCGSNRAQIQGDINLVIQGGVFENLFGGSKGRLNDPITPDNEYYKSDIDGNVTLIITGGTIGNLFGGCDLNGNITGKIGINIYEGSDANCPLFIGNIYGGGRLTNTEPDDATIISPDIKILKGEIGGTTANLPILNYTSPTTYEGNVYGGGYQGNVKSNPRVIVGDGSVIDTVVILGSVYGGGFEGQIDGSSQVIVVPKQYTFTYDEPSGDNVIRVTNLLGQAVTSGTTLGEGMDLLIEAIPSVYGQSFDHWDVTGADAGVGNATSTTTTFTMGTEDSELTPVFEALDPSQIHVLTITQPTGGNGSITVKDGQGNEVPDGSGISEGAVLTLVATPNSGYKLEGWTNTGDGVIRNNTSPRTIFTMGTSDDEITASFIQTPLHIFEYGVSQESPVGSGTITVTDASNNNVSSGNEIAEGTELTLSATAASGYRFVKWTIEYGDGVVREMNVANTTFMMRTRNTKVVAEFAVE